MRFVHSGLATPGAGIEDDARAARRIGADGLEVAAAKLGPVLEAGGLAGLVAAVRRHGVRAISVAALADVTFRDLAGTEAVTAGLHRLAEVARALGATWIVVTPGERPDGADARDAAREARATLGRLVRVGERYDVGLALMPLGRPQASVRTVREALEVIDAVGRPGLALAPDTFEAWAAGSRPEDLRACHPRALAMLRIADAPAGLAPESARGHHRREPGSGAVPVAAWLALAMQVAAGGTVTCAVEGPPDAAAEAWARRLRERALALAVPAVPGSR